MRILKKIIELPSVKAQKEQRMEFARKILCDIHSVCQKRKVLNAKYGLASDDDLIESIIYEELALKSRYNYLVRLANDNDVALDKKCIFVKWDNE